MTGWKKKEKQLTPEEAIALAKKELASAWFNTEPLLAPISSESGVSVLPLNAEFSKHAWLYVFCDPTELSGEEALRIAHAWHARYAQHKLGFIAVFRAPSQFLKGAHELLRKFRIEFPAMYDQDGLFATAFGVRSLPAVVVQGPAKEIARSESTRSFDKVEEAVQVHLRQSDPGLSLSPPFRLSHPLVEHSRIDFGSLHGKPIAGMKSQLQLQGEWKESDNHLSTSDPKATATITSPAPYLGLLAESEVPLQTPKVLIESVDGSMSEEWTTDEVTLDENNKGSIETGFFGLYALLKDLPANHRAFRLSFPDARTAPIRLYGLRFGARS